MPAATTARPGEPFHEDRRDRDQPDPHPVRHGGETRLLRRRRLAGDEHPVAAGRHRQRHRGLGRGLRPRLRRRHPQRARYPDRARRAGPGRARHRRAARTPVQDAASVRPQRAACVCVVGARHRAVGHRRQAGGLPLWRLWGATPAASAARLRQPAALRRPRPGGRRRRTRRHARLRRHQAARDRGADDPRGARRARRRAAADGRYELPLDGGGGDRRWPARSAPAI